MRGIATLSLLGIVLAIASASAEENFAAWPVLKSTFPSTGGGGMMIKGYDPVVAGKVCTTTFMAVSPDPVPLVYPGLVEFEAVETQGGTLCHNGKWKTFDGTGSGTTPFRVFWKDGVFRGQ